MLIAEVYGPEASTSSQVKNTLWVGVRIVWRGETELVIEAEEKQMMLQVFGESISV